MYKCTYCDKEYKNPKALGGHKVWCKKNPKREKSIQKLKEKNIGKKLSEETKQKISKSRTKYLLENPEQIPYKLNHSSKMSFPEKTFQKYLKKYNIEGWVYNYSFSIYSLDFAFPEWKLDVEIDGKTHLNERVKAKDKRRDEYLKSKGWETLRFTASEIKKDIYKCLNILLEKLKSDKIIEIPKEFLKISLNKIEKQKAEEKKQKIKLEKINKIKKELLDSDIDFQKYGWISKASKIIGITPQNTKKWIKKHLPNIYEESYKR